MKLKFRYLMYVGLALYLIAGISVGMIFLGYAGFRWVANIAIFSAFPYVTMCAILAALGKIDRH